MRLRGPNNVGESCANGSNIVALIFSGHGTKETLVVVGSKGWMVSNFAQKLPTTCNRVCKRTQHVTSSNCWEFLVNIVASVFTGLNIYSNSTRLECFHGFLCVCYQVISIFSYVWKPCVPVPDHILKNAKSLGFKLNSPVLMFLHGLQMTSLKIKLRNYRFFWVSTFTRYYST